MLLEIEIVVSGRKCVHDVDEGCNDNLLRLEAY